MKFMPCEEFAQLNQRLSGLRAGDCRLVGKIETYTVKATADDKRLKSLLQTRYEPEPAADAPAAGMESTVWRRRRVRSGTLAATPQAPARRRFSVQHDTQYRPYHTTLPPPAPEPWPRGAAPISIVGAGAPPRPTALSSSSSMSSLSPRSNPTHRKTFLYLLSTLNNMFGPDYDFSDVSPAYFMCLPSYDLVVTQVQNELANFGDGRLASEIGHAIWNAIDDVMHLDECECWRFSPDPEMEPEGEEGGILWSFYYFFYNRKLKRVTLFACRALHLLSSSQEEDDALSERAGDAAESGDIPAPVSTGRPGSASLRHLEHRYARRQRLSALPVRGASSGFEVDVTQDGGLFVSDR